MKSAKYNYAPGAIYSYQFDSTIAISLTGADQQESKTQIQGIAQIFVENNCVYTLQLQRVNIIAYNGAKTSLTPDGGRSDTIPDFKKPVRFIMSNDEISPEICSDEDDNEFSLNLKRAIISIIQSSEGKDFETDIYGTCPTFFSSNNIDGTQVIRKSRNLNSCTHRESLVSGFITGIDNDNAGIRSTALLNGEYSVEQRIKNGILESSVVTETYNFIPFTSGSAGAQAKIVTLLTASGSSAGPSIPINKPKSSSIIFENPIDSTVSNSQNIKDAIKRVLSSYTNNVGATTAEEFVNLIRLLRTTKADDLTLLYNNVKSGAIGAEQKELTKRIFFDALFRTGTGESVEVLSKLAKELTPEELKIMFLSLNLVNTMTKKALDNIKVSLISMEIFDLLKLS